VQWLLEPPFSVGEVEDFYWRDTSTLRVIGMVALDTTTNDFVIGSCWLTLVP